jgi:hypothetical protein
VYLPSDRIDLEGGGEDMLGEGMDVKIPKQEFIKEHKKLIPLLKKGSQSEREKEAQDQSEELKKIMKGGALFTDMIIEDSLLKKKEEKITLGDDENITIKKYKSSFPNDATHYINLFPTGKRDNDLHLEVRHNGNELHIISINTNKMKSQRVGTYLFNILFKYLKYRKMSFDTISLVFDPYEEDETGKKIRSPAISMRAMKFYYRIFSQMADHYPMIIEQVRRPTEADFQRIIDDYEKGNENMIFRKSNVF